MSLPGLGPRYEALRELGRGGMGRALLVRDRRLGKDLALKLLDAPLDPGALERFRAEFALLARIEHPAIARAHDFGILDGRPCFTCEFIPGDTLEDLCRAGKVPPIIPLAKDLTRALAFLHRAGILHLDVKPSNIVVAPGPRPVLIDFGIFRGSGAPPEAVVRGSIPYMAPERFRGEALGPWTDVFSLGVTVYRAAAGRFPRGTEGEERWEPSPAPPSRFAPGIPRDLDGIVLRCLALDPRSRFRDAGEVLTAFEGIRGGEAEAVQGASLFARTVGLEDEIARIDRFLDGFSGKAAEKPEPRVVPGAPVLLVTAAPGMGQTHLFREIKLRAQIRGLRLYLESGYPGRPGTPASLLGPLRDHIAEKPRRRLDAFLARQRRPRTATREETPEEERRFRRAEEAMAAVAALREPLVLAVDGLQWLDEVSVMLLADIARALIARDPAARPPLGIVAGYREEGPSERWLRELTAGVLRPGSGDVISLKPLGPREALDLHRSRGGKDSAEGCGLGIFQRTGGAPARIVALAKSGTGSSIPGEAEGGSHVAGRLRPDERRALLALAILKRPAAPPELARLAGLSPKALATSIPDLRSAGWIEETAGDPGEKLLLAGPLAKALLLDSPAGERRRVHRRIALALERRRAVRDDPFAAEIVEHARAAGRKDLVVRRGLPLARKLKATFRSGAARDLYRRVLDALPRGRWRERLDVSLELSDVLRRTGDLDEAVKLLRRILSGPRGPREPWRTRAVLKMATLLSRQGDFRRADELFREGLGKARTGKTNLGREEFLAFIEEHAAFKAFVGDHEAALSLSREGLALAGRSRSRKIREVVLSFHATLGGVALRALRLDEAIRSYETALGIAESIGSLGTRAVVLNNLGIACTQSDRYAEAIRAFREARETCLRIDEGPSLTFILGNLALLHAKTGDFAACEEALAEAGRLCGGSDARPGEGEAPAPGRRQALFLAHHRGLSLLYRGRHSEARPHIEAAIRMGEEVGDRLLVSFDSVYRAECLVFEGIYSEAQRELERLAGSGAPAAVRRMALARRALLLGTAARADESREAASRRESVTAERPVPFLEAWDDLLLGWGLSLAGDDARALDLLLASERYFRLHGLRPAASLAAAIRGEGALLAGRIDACREAIDASAGPAGAVAEVLRSLLAARAALEAPEGGAARARAADLLAEAAAALVGIRLPEWELRLDALRAIVRGERGSGAEEARTDTRRLDLARELPGEARAGYLGSRHWQAWTAPLKQGGPSLPVGVRAKESVVRPPAASRRPADELTRVLSREGGALLRSRLVARSPGMRRLLAALERLRESDLPVLVRGEIGTGKEMVARLIHAESRRFAGPFAVVDLATIPAPLLEVELFGARAGAFTDLTGDRTGVLVRAAGGTVLIEDIAEAPPEVQAKLLRVLSSMSIRPVGGEVEAPLDVRFLFATARDLEAEVREGRFREDLLHRVRVLEFEVPPLRERPEDLPGLVAMFLREGQASGPLLGRGLLDRLAGRTWPGNVRELKNLIARLKLEHPREIPAAAVEDERGPASTIVPRSLLGGSLAPLRDRLEREWIVHHLERSGGDARAVSRLLGISRKHFYRRCRQLGISLREERRRRRPG